MSSSGGSISAWIGGKVTVVNATVVAVVAAAAGAAMIPVVSGGGGGVSCDATISSGNIRTSLSSLTAGQTLCLNAGSGYSWSGGALTKSSLTTVRAASGLDRDDVTITGGLTLNGSSNLAFKTMTVEGADVGASGAPATHMLFEDVHWTSCVQVNMPTNAVLDITFDGGLADMSSEGSGTGSPCFSEGRFSIYGMNTDAQDSSDKQITIKNIEFTGQAHCTDGIQITGGGAGWTIGPGNEFHGILQNDPIGCESHVDPIQFFGSEGGVITGNYFHDNTDGILTSNGNGDNTTVRNNVFGENGDSYPDAVVDCGGDNMVYDHNVFLDDNLRLCNSTAPADDTGNTTVTNSYLAGGFGDWGGQADCTGTTTDYILKASTTGLCGGTHNIAGTPTFAGGASPTTFAGFALATGSAGKGAASDGLDIGVNP